MRRIRFAASLLLSLGTAASVCLGDDDVTTCTTCHASEAKELGASIHAGFGCQKCHQGALTYPLPVEEARRYARSLASGGAVAPFEHGDAFAGKPGRAAVPALCGECHADVVRMNPYGLRTDQLSRYWTSRHGRTLASKGDERVAVCTDCHGVHGILHADDPSSLTYPLNVPDMCGMCHGDEALMAEYGLPVSIVEEYRRSVHGRLLLEQNDTGAPTCATCHGNHSAMPPGFADVGAVCGRCHQHAAKDFGLSVHATVEGHKGCVQCHGGGEGTNLHLIERITKPTGIMIQQYAHLLESDSDPTPEQFAASIHPDPKEIITRSLSTCLECHDEIDEDESLPRLFALLDDIAAAEMKFVQTGLRLDRVGKGVLLVDRQRFRFEDAKTYLIALAPLQHTLDAEKVAAKVADLNAVCDEVNAELTDLERGLARRRAALTPIWLFAVGFAAVLYIKFKRLKKAYVKPLPPGGIG